ncbi:hypothetical protein GF319_12195 [Candidatus Bathyarchaeota archaeon]|jgi:hypothetical protein|nr:hypothetical protein [Candidatus Bathyarchaeota archaeon]
MSSKTDLYTSAHKGQRYQLSKINTKAGNLDSYNPKALESLISEFEELRKEFFLHAALEEKYIHPLLYERKPEGASDIEEDHRKQRKQLDDLNKHLNSLQEKPINFEKRGEIALEFYRGLNRFTADYLVHVDMEEESIQPLLWNLCTDEELVEAYGRLISSMEFEELMMFLKIMFPAMNIYERSMMLENSKKIGTEAYDKISELAENVLDTDDWLELKSRLKKE